MNNFDLKKYLAEGKLYEAINLDIEDDIAILSGDSGEYEGEIEDGKASFSVIYDDLDYRISDQYNENNIEDFLGKDHAFVELAKKYDHKWGIERDLVGITIKLKDLAEGKLNEEEITWDIDAYDDAADVSDAADDFLPEVKRLIQQEIGDEMIDGELEEYIEVSNDYYYRKARKNAKGSDPENISITAKAFADNVIENYKEDQ